MLARDRQLRPAHRIEQIDAACLRWLARQPGRSVPEKAGPRQRVLSVVRVEDADTHENRVVRDLVVRAARACELYLREHRGHGNHARIDLVRRFGDLQRRLIRESAVGGAGRLASAAQPNYVLLHDDRYRPLWSAYQRLVRHQMLLDSAWRWQQRVWSETCVFAALAAIDRLSGNAARRTARSDLVLQAEHVTGRFIDPATALGPIAFGPGVYVDAAIGAAALERFAGGALRACAALAPDLTLGLRTRTTTGRPAVCIWGILGLGLDRGLGAAARHLSEQLPDGVWGLLLLPELAGAEGAPPPDLGLARCSVLRLPMPPQLGVGRLAEALRMFLPVHA